MSDIELIEGSEVNQQLANQVRDSLDALTIDKVYVSPLKRAIQTAQLIGLNEYEISPLVGEMSFGAYEGKPKTEMISAFEGKWESDPMATELRGELEELSQRIHSFLSMLEKDKNYLIVSHGAFIRAMKSIIETGSIDQMNTIEFQNGEMLSIPL